jgi:hypothetical protein
MRHPFLISLLATGLAASASAQEESLLPASDMAALANEVSGQTAKQTLEGLVGFHRQRGSQGFHGAAELVAERARSYGLADVEILRFPADGKIFYGTQRSRPAWDATRGELSEVVGDKETTIASYADMPVALAEDSESAELSAELVDVGEGASESDYAGKDVRGKFVLVGAQPDRAQELAVGKFGAAGLVSHGQNQKTGWSGDNIDQVRWGHLDSFSPNKTFAFMVSSRTARALQARLAKGESIRLHASVKAGQHSGAYEVVTATIPGADPRLKDEEIAFSCHLDHQKPGANDNASGCATILEVARTLQTLIGSGALARPARTIRFLWPPEIEGTVTLLNARPDLARRIRAVVHMDMVGGGPATQAVFHVTRGPASLPSFVHDVAWSFAQWVNAQSYAFAASGKADFPMLAPNGGKEPLRAENAAFEMGSDHEVYQDSSFAIPAVYLNDWPDRYIHTNLDSAANIDATKLGRVAFIGAASGYSLANDPRFAQPAARPAASATQVQASGDGRLVFRRNGELRGPLKVFGYDYFAAHAKAAGLATPKLLDHAGASGSGFEYGYEALNFVDGRRNAQQIADALSAEFGAVPLALVLEYLRALEAIGVVRHSP